MLGSVFGVGLDDLRVRGLQVLAPGRLHLDHGLAICADGVGARWDLEGGLAVDVGAVHCGDGVGWRRSGRW